ncbi:MAG: amidohydrolase family protein [Balneolaceae bacterium]
MMQRTSMSKLTVGILLYACILFSACGGDEPENLIAYTNATIWAGTDQPSQENSALIVRNGKVHEIISMTDSDLQAETETVDLSGSYIIPGLINAHGHVGMTRGLQTGPEIHSEQNVIDQLRLYARYGITTVVSLGDEPPDAFEVRDNLDPADHRMARLFLAGPVLSPPNPGEAAKEVEKLMERNPDWTKIRVDDNLGRSDKMSPEVYTAVIQASHEHGVPLAAHIVTLEDAKGVLESNADLIAHSVRDEPVDHELIELMLERDICITPTLTREFSVYVYANRPEFFDDPFFLKDADPQVLEQLQEPQIQQRYTGMAADYYRETLPLAKENMMTLHQEGVRVALGTDSGPPARFQGYFEYMEMEMMQDAGMLPGEILLTGTRYAAECMQIDDRVGTLKPGKEADFIVLNKNPFDNIQNLREIRAVYVGGNEVELTE